MAVQSVTGTTQADWGSPANSSDLTATVRQGENSVAELAARLGVSTEELLKANPQLASVSRLPAGMEVRVPEHASETPEPSEAADDTDDEPQAMPDAQAESRMEGEVRRAMMSAPADAAGQTDATDAASADPRFAAVNQALQAGDGDAAAAAAQQLISSLQAEKPPQAQLLNQARMTLAAASLLQGDLDSASQALSSVNSKKLDDNDAARFGALCDLAKDARRASYSDAMQATADADGGAEQAKNAANEAGRLVSFLQKTDPSNTADITEAKLKQANALLLSQDYRGAEKVLNGVNEKVLDPDQKKYLDGMRSELHGQQVGALARAYSGDMQRKDYSSAVSDSRALVNDVAKYSPDDKQKLVAARMELATAQIMKGDMEDARTTLGRIPASDVKDMSEGIQGRVRQLNGAVKEHFDNVKKEQELQAEQTVVQGQLKTINDLATSGNKASAQKAVPLAEKLVADIQAKHPESTDAIAGAKLTLANAKIAAGDTAGAKADLEKIAASSTSPAIQEEAQYLQGRAELKENHLGKGLKILQNLSDNGKTPELRDAAKQSIIAVETSHLRMVDQKADLERDQLHKIDNEKADQGKFGQFFSMPSKPLSAVDQMQQDDNTLRRTAEGAAMISGLMKRNGMTLAQFQKLSFAEITAMVGHDNAHSIALALKNPDVQAIGKHDLQGGDLSWQNNTLYVDTSYLDSSLDKIGQWVGDRVRGARKEDEELVAGDSLAGKALGYASGFIMDKLSDANGFIKDKLKQSAEFYNDPERRDTWYGKLGRDATWAGDMLASTFTMPATVLDYKADDRERGGAIAGTAVMAATMGAFKYGGPAWRSISNYAGRYTARIAASDAAQWIARSEFGQVAGKGVQVLARGVGKVTDKLAKFDAGLQDSAFGKTVDRITAKVNPVLWGGKVAPTKTMDEVIDGMLEEKTPAQLRAEVTDAQIEAKKKSFRKHGENPDEYTKDELAEMVVGDRIYSKQYNPSGEAKPHRITQSDFERQYSRYEGPTKNNGPWHRRFNEPKPGEVPANQQEPAWLHGEVRRFYFNVKPDRAAELADDLAKELNVRGVNFQYKMPKDISKFNRSDSGVLYVERSEYARVKDIVTRYAKNHPDAFVGGSPAFTKPIAKGVSAAEEPIQSGLTPKPGGIHSFGTSRAGIAAEAILRAPAGATKEEIKQLVRQRLRSYGFNPDKPWLRQGATVDDL